VSPAPVQRRLPAAERRAIIVESAVGVFSERGYTGASLDDIAAAAGVTKPMLYRHFASKADLYVALLESEIELLLGGMREAAGRHTELEPRVRALVDAFFEYVERDPFARRLLFRAPEAEADVAAAHDRIQQRLTDAVAELLGANASLLAGDPGRELALEIYAQALKTGLNGMAAWWLAHPEVARGEMVERTMELVWSGLGEL
jgi:AcrR family transcriptional regulator